MIKVFSKILFLSSLLSVGFLFFSCKTKTSVVSLGNDTKKREFRAAWIQCVNGQFQGLSTSDMQKNLLQQLNVLKSEGANAIIFQVRPECDALYQSNIEPWSKFLTGRQGQAPSPYWDPLQWMIDECHKRNMELHAWINPYRALTKSTKELASNHIAALHPEYCFKYDGLTILNPAYKECRDYTCRVVADIVSRYDVDGIHIDDYFYPYPAGGQPIPDSDNYNYYVQHSQGKTLSLGDWRRNNVNVFIQQLSATIKKIKPWVKFGVSPFGIYRNKRNDPNGSETNGTQNYDDLYADCLLWDKNGWIDYTVPQLYWQIGHKAADYKTLIRWWSKNFTNRPLYIGEDIERTVDNKDINNPSQDQMAAKYQLHEEVGNVKGTVLWYSRRAVDNYGNYGSRLQKNYWNGTVLQPKMPFIDGDAPDEIKNLKFINSGSDNVLFWTAPNGKNWKNQAVRYIVYRFEANDKIDLNNSAKIVAYTTSNYYKLPAPNKKKTVAYYCVTALDRMQNESKGVKIKVKY